MAACENLIVIYFDLLGLKDLLLDQLWAANGRRFADGQPEDLAKTLPYLTSSQFVITSVTISPGPGSLIHFTPLLLAGTPRFISTSDMNHMISFSTTVQRLAFLLLDRVLALACAHYCNRLTAHIGSSGSQRIRPPAFAGLHLRIHSCWE